MQIGRRFSSTEAQLIEERFLDRCRINTELLTVRWSFGPATVTAIAALQTRHGLDLTGILDIPTIKAINAQFFTVRGRVTLRDGTPAVGVPVEAYDVDPRHREQLGNPDQPARTNDEGRYIISYSAAQFARAEKKSVDLLVEIDAEDQHGTPLQASSPLIMQAGRDEVVDLVIDAGLAPPDNEHDVLRRMLAPLVKFVETSTASNDFLADKISQLRYDETNNDPLQNEALFISRELDLRIDDVIGMIWACDLAIRTDLPSAAFWAFYRDGLPLELEALTNAGQPRLHRALRDGIRQNLIASELRRQIRPILHELRSLRVRLELESLEEIRKSGLANVLSVALPDAERIGTVIGEINAYDRLEDIDWSRISLDEREVSEVQLAIGLGSLARNYRPLVRELWRTRGHWREGFSDIRGLARYAGRMREFLDQPAEDGERIGAPASVHGTSEDERAESFALEIEQILQKAFPTTIVGSKLRSEARQEDQDVAHFLLNPTNESFDLRSTNVDPYLRATPAALEGVADARRATEQLKLWQRMHRLVQPIGGTFEDMRALRDAGYTGGQKIATTSQTGFVGDVRDLIEEDKASLIHDAREVSMRSPPWPSRRSRRNRRPLPRACCRRPTRAAMTFRTTRSSS